LPPTACACLLFRWNERYIEAKLSLDDRAAKLDAVAELVEKDLILLGCTAIEDKLQEGVPKTIKTLAEAGIRLWVLTGDKMVGAIFCDTLSRVWYLVVALCCNNISSGSTTGSKSSLSGQPAPTFPLIAARWLSDWL
jgi:hypothetical protein